MSPGPDFRQKVVLIAVRSAGALRGNARQPAVCIIGIIRNAVQRIRDGIEQAFAFRIVVICRISSLIRDRGHEISAVRIGRAADKFFPLRSLHRIEIPALPLCKRSAAL